MLTKMWYLLFYYTAPAVHEEVASANSEWRMACIRILAAREFIHSPA